MKAKDASGTRGVVIKIPEYELTLSLCFAWAIPVDAKRPVDKRITMGKYKNWRKKLSDE